jgi:hypothetical protein
MYLVPALLLAAIKFGLFLFSRDFSKCTIDTGPYKNIIRLYEFDVSLYQNKYWRSNELSLYYAIIS